ncbi:MAG TPA: inositol monophosphatase family protein [Actinomycetota bacterium]|nr:inositol monophosphatase family protein [Actinomycetota bacterium]
MGEFDDAALARYRGVAELAVGVGARVVAEAWGKSAAPEPSKGFGDYVTAADRESEAAMTELLGRLTPDIPVLGEEAGGEHGETFWAVDPLDGTTNFLIGFPVVAVSAALISAGSVWASAVRAPLLDFAASAARGQGAWAGDRRLEVSTRGPEQAIVATALPFRARELLPRYGPVLQRVFDRTEDIRRAGAAELDLAWVASGVFDGYFELNLSIWDIAAGSLLVEEAGGVVTDWEGEDGYLTSGNVLAGSPLTHPVLLEAATRQDSTQNVSRFEPTSVGVPAAEEDESGWPDEPEP